MNQKDRKIIDDAERDGIPIFVLTAKDKCTGPTLQKYFEEVMMESYSESFHVAVIDRIEEFEAWQAANPDKVKIPY